MLTEEQDKVKKTLHFWKRRSPPFYWRTLSESGEEEEAKGKEKAPEVEKSG